MILQDRLNAFAKATAPRVLLYQKRSNKNSLAVLLGALEADLPNAIWQADVLPIEMAPTALQAISANGAVVLAFSFHTLDLPDVVPAVHRIRSERGGRPVFLLAGGAHASGDPGSALAAGFDGVIAGEGEVAFPGFLEALCRGEGLPDVPGLTLAGASELAAPAGHVDIEHYPPFAPKSGKIAPIEISRGCPFRCAYCQTSDLMGRRTRHRSVPSLLHWFDAAKRLGMSDLRVVTPNALGYGAPNGIGPDLDRLETLLGGANAIFLREHVWFGSFPSEVRPESVTAESVELIRRFAANDHVVMGAQSGSDRMLERLGRGHDTAEVWRAAEVIVGAGFTPIIDFIFGLPGETLRDRALTRDFAARLSRLGARVHSHAFMPLPGSAFSHQAPAALDPETTRFLGDMGRKGHQFGRWQSQQERALPAVTLWRELAAKYVIKGV